MPRSRKNAPPEPRDAQLVHTGKAFGLMHSIWRRFGDIIERGHPYAHLRDLSALPDADRRYAEDYLNLTSIEPKIRDLVSERPVAELASQLDKGRNEFRSSQIHSINEEVAQWGVGVPMNKMLRGFGDDVCGRFLCPSTRDWEDETTREQLRTFQIRVTADDFPAFLWENERADPQDMMRGFLRGKLLVKALLCILIGPAAAHPGKQSSGAGGYADRFNLQTMTIPAVVFAATAVRFALSSEPLCHWTLKSNAREFENLLFYQKILSTVEKWPKQERASLVSWWNRMILSHLRGGVHSGPFGDAPAPGSAAAIMLQQVADMSRGPF